MVTYPIDIDLSKYTETDHAAEFDDVSAALAAVCETSRTNGTIALHFGTPEWCAASAAWHTTHTPDRALPGGMGDDSIYRALINYEAFCYDCETHAFTPLYESEKAQDVRETYIAHRSRDKKADDRWPASWMTRAPCPCGQGARSMSGSGCGRRRIGRQRVMPRPHTTIESMLRPRVFW